MFNLGISELLVLAVIALFVIGPEKLPEVARNVVKFINDLKRTTADIMKPIDDMKKEAFKMVDETKKSVMDATGTEEIRKAFDFEDDFHNRHEMVTGEHNEDESDNDDHPYDEEDKKKNDGGKPS